MSLLYTSLGSWTTEVTPEITWYGGVWASSVISNPLGLLNIQVDVYLDPDGNWTSNPEVLVGILSPHPDDGTYADIDFTREAADTPDFSDSQGPSVTCLLRPRVDAAADSSHMVIHKNKRGKLLWTPPGDEFKIYIHNPSTVKVAAGSSVSYRLFSLG